MQIRIIKPDNTSAGAPCGDKLIRLCLSNPYLNRALCEYLREQWTGPENKITVSAVPNKWRCDSNLGRHHVLRYNKNINLGDKYVRLIKKRRWFSIANGRYLARINNQIVQDLLNNIQADLVFINAAPRLKAGGEKVKLTPQNRVAGFRRLYCDSTTPATIPPDWPHQMLIKSSLFDKLFEDGKIPTSSGQLLKKCESENLLLRSFDVAGTVFDLNTEKGLLHLLNSLQFLKKPKKYKDSVAGNNNVQIPPSAKIFGNVLFGKNVRIAEETVISGPCIICDNAGIDTKSVINSSIVGPNVTVTSKSVLQNRVLVNGLKESTKSHITTAEQSAGPFVNHSFVDGSSYQFRHWAKFSYAAFAKRIADFLAASIVLILFAPFLPFIAAAIKLTSKGPVFFKAPRQGLNGKTFNCLKFRTMQAGAEKIQDRLRILNNVDGPQFKMDDDPRITAVGNFLRETYIDEIPQFFNVLFGQMSVVGPRPSPESENTLRATWRDARLSVRPGITGLWQVCRTRQPNKDFQEWIYYDTKYIKELSLKMDLWICRKTAGKLIMNFAHQF